MVWLHRILKRVPLYVRALDYSKTKTLPGFEGLSMHTVFGYMFRELNSEDLNMRASSLSFNFFMALFPAIIFFFTTLAFLPIKNSTNEVLNFLKEVVPGTTYQSIRTTVLDILKNQRGGWLSIGFLSAIYFSSNGIYTMMKAFNKFQRSRETRTIFKKRMVSVLLTFWISLLLILSVALVLSSNMVLNSLFSLDLFNHKFLGLVFNIIRWVVLIVLLFAIISSLYYFAPAKRRRWRFFSAGSTLATILCILTTIVFSFYVNNFAAYSKIYGSIGTLLVILLLIHFNSMIILIGFELNSSIDSAVIAKLNPEEMTLTRLRSMEYRTRNENVQRRS